MAKENNAEPDPELATRTGDLALLLFSVGTPRNFTFRPKIVLNLHNMQPSRCFGWDTPSSPGPT